MKRIFATFLLSALLTLTPAVASAAPTAIKTTTLGYDISYPQCNKTISTVPAFTIVGVNGGKASLPNPCLRKQLSWAANSTGLIANQDKVQLYVNTASPGNDIDLVASWPNDNIGQDGSDTTGLNRYGTCQIDPATGKGADSPACAWQYGWERAYDAVQTYFASAVPPELSADPLDYYWWLDVETLNSWHAPDETDGYLKNVASLEGMTQYYTSLGTPERAMRIGLYSTTYQWGQITGNAIAPDSPLQNRDTWYALGSTTLATAKAACTKQKPLVASGSIVLTQFISKNLDNNFACPA